MARFQTARSELKMQHTAEYNVNNLQAAFNTRLWNETFVSQAGFELGSDPRILDGRGIHYTTTMPGEAGSSFYVFVSYDFFFIFSYLLITFFVSIF